MFTRVRRLSFGFPRKALQMNMLIIGMQIVSLGEVVVIIIMLVEKA